MNALIGRRPLPAGKKLEGAAAVKLANTMLLGCAIDAPKNGLRVQAAAPPADAIADVERIMQAAAIEVGGIEYLVDDPDGQRYN